MNTLFPLGRTAITADALAALRRRDLEAMIPTILARHELGDWGDVSDEDRKANDAAVKEEERLLSSYNIRDDFRIWVITECDRSMTTILLPEDY